MSYVIPQPYDSDLTLIAEQTNTAYGLSFLVLADALAARALIGVSNGLNADMTRTSTSSNYIGIGQKVFTFAASSNLGWALGQRIRATALPSFEWMEGQIDAVTSTSVSFFVVDGYFGSGTKTSWTLSISGEPGMNGNDGLDGSVGPAGTISIGTVTTGAPGSSASVINVGTASAAVLNITIPRGDTGASGSGSGDVSKSGTPSTGQAAEWNGASTIIGVAVVGTGSYVKATSPTLVTPVLGVASATTVNKVAITAPATGATLTIQDGFTLTVSGNSTLSGTNSGDETGASIRSKLGISTLSGSNTGDQDLSAYATIAFVNSAVTGLLDLKTTLDCSSNPNYPAASKGDCYPVTVAGKIGGASGVSVEVGDMIACLVDNAGGTQAAVGSSWFILEHNLVGAVIVGGALGTPSSGNLINCTFPTLNQSTTGNAATATALQTARTINGVAFDGTANITIGCALGNVTGFGTGVAAALALATNGAGGVLVLASGGLLSLPGTLRMPVETLTYGASIAVDISVSNKKKVTLTGSPTFSAPIGTPADMDQLIFRITQGGTGSYTPGWGSIYKFRGLLASITWSTAVGAKDYITFVYDSSVPEWDCVAFSKGS
jgi:hypothetical protein